MKKLVILIAVLFVVGVAYASDIGVEPLLNKVYDSTNNVVKSAIYTSTATSERILVSKDSFVILSAANSDRNYFRVQHISADSSIWFNLRASADAVVGTGILLYSKGTTPDVWEMPVGWTYTGEISANAASEDTQVIVTEY